MPTLLQALEAQANPEQAKIAQRFFKTGPGEYGEHDVFWGIPNPKVREIAKQYRALPTAELALFLQHPVHEVRLAVLIIAVHRAKKDPEDMFRLYSDHLIHINNWDLVDISAASVVGGYVFHRDRELLDEWACTDHLWTQRSAIIATLYFIRQHQYEDTFRLAELLIHHPHDLMHKAVGWMLREIWKRKGSRAVEAFIQKHYADFPRTALRYAIEKMPEPQRQMYLKGQFS